MWSTLSEIRTPSIRKLLIIYTLSAICLCDFNLWPFYRTLLMIWITYTPNFTVIGMWLCTGIPNFIRIRPSATELWRHIDFPRWRPYWRKLTSVYGYGYWLRLTFLMVKTICVPNVDQISQSTAVLSVFWKQTAAISKFYFRFLFWPFHCHRHVVLHRHTKFYHNTFAS